jgi:hypothetical protein
MRRTWSESVPQAVRKIATRRASDVNLGGNEVVGIPLISFCPEARAVASPVELCNYTHTPFVALVGSLQDVRHILFARDLVNGCLRALVLHRAARSNGMQTLRKTLFQTSGYLVDHAVAQLALSRIHIQILEWQN